MLTYDGKVMQYTINYESSLDKDHSKMVDYIIEQDTVLRNKIVMLGEIKKKHSFSQTNEAVFARFKRRVSDSLGPVRSELGADLNANAEYKRHYQTLMFPVYYNLYGDLCGRGASEPVGRLAIQYFEDRNDSVAIRSFVKGYNPEGRIYAIESLLHSAKRHRIILTNDDIRCINAVLSLNLLIHTCDGCWGKDKLANQIFPSDMLELLR